MSFTLPLRLTRLAFVSVLTISLLLVSSQTNAQTTHDLPSNDKLTNFGKMLTLTNFRAADMKTTSDDGFILAGDEVDEIIDPTINFIRNRPRLAKLDKDLNVVWQKVYDYNDEPLAYFRAVQQTSDGGYIAAGTRAFANKPDISEGLIVKVDMNGNIQWDIMYRTNTPSLDIQQFTSIKQTRDDGYIVAGELSTQSDTGHVPVVMKLSASGTVQWAKTYPLGTSSRFSIINQLNNDYILVANEFLSGGLRVVKLGNSGNITSNNTYIKTARTLIPRDSEITKDDNLIVTGYIENSDGSADSDGFVTEIKLSDNSVKWHREYNQKNQFDEFESISEISGSEFLVSGISRLNKENPPTALKEILFLRIDSRGSIKFQKEFGTTDPTFYSQTVVQSSDNHIVSTGAFFPDGLFTNPPNGMSTVSLALKLPLQDTGTIFCNGLEDGAVKIDNGVKPAFVTFPHVENNVTVTLNDLSGTTIDIDAISGGLMGGTNSGTKSCE